MATSAHDGNGGAVAIRHQDVAAGDGSLLGVDFLRLLCTQPDGHAVAFALVNGPCAPFGAKGCAIFLIDTERSNLILVGEHGFGAGSLERYQVIPLGVEIPGTQVFRTGEPLVLRGQEAEEKFPLLAAFYQAEPNERESDWICLPLTYLGVGIGVIVISCPPGTQWGWNEQSHFTGFAAAISLWARLQLTTANLSYAGSRRANGTSVALTERQRQVLTGIQHGWPNKVIARELGYSISTIKAEVQEILARLGAADRRDAILKAQRAGIPLVELDP